MKNKTDEIDCVLDRAALVVENLPEWKRRVEKKSEQEYLSRKKFVNPPPQEDTTKVTYVESNVLQ